MAEDEDEMPSIDDLVFKYRQFRTAIEDIKNEAEEKCKPYAEAMVTIENFLAGYMHELKLTSLPTANGTAYQTTVTSVKITDKTAFMNYAIDKHKDLLQFSCNKTALKEYEEERNKKGVIIKPAKPYPPGIEVTKINRVNVRGT